jgi:hypothetical protein
MSDSFCHKHNINAEDERWKVVFEEMTNPDDSEHCEPFRGQVCPLCFLHLKERLVEAKRNLKVESRESVRLRQEVDRIQAILDAVIATVRQLSSKDPAELAKQTYQKFPSVPGLVEQGTLENILPNLIVELANKGKK